MIAMSKAKVVFTRRHQQRLGFLLGSQLGDFESASGLVPCSNSEGYSLTLPAVDRIFRKR